MTDNSIFEIPGLLSRLLVDHSTSKPDVIHNVFWATSDYEGRGKGYQYIDEITPEAISGNNENAVIPRVLKRKSEQSARSKEMAEVFTPSWLCNRMNNSADEQWFGVAGTFNKETVKNGVQTWIVSKKKISFPEGKTWMDYVRNTRLEITCGEAPFLVSRYDTTTGESIPVARRIGILDRKLRVIKENTSIEEEWYEATLMAFKSVYGYEWQGDSLILARKALLLTFVDYYKAQFKKDPDNDKLFEIAEVISWNLWQMDGLKYVVPGSCHDEEEEIFGNIFGEPEVKTNPCPGCTSGNPKLHNGIKCRIMDWKKGSPVLFIDSMK